MLFKQLRLQAYTENSNTHPHPNPPLEGEEILLSRRLALLISPAYFNRGEIHDSRRHYIYTPILTFPRQGGRSLSS
jgi:hypothetical protein